MTTMTDQERAESTARVVFLMPGLTAAGLRAVRETAELWAARDPRDLTSGTLAAEQAARHGLLADAEATLCKARRERTHGLACDCGACTSQTAAMHERDAMELHDSATDAAAVLGASVTSTAAFVSSETEDTRKRAHRGEPPPFVMSEEAARERVSHLNQRFTSYDGGDRPMSPPVSLMRELAAAEADLARRLAGSIDRPRMSHLSQHDRADLGIASHVSEHDRREVARLMSIGADPIIEGIRASQRGRE